MLEDVWGNPPRELTWGMIFPTGAEKGPFAENGWGVVLEYAEDGWVSDEDAEEIDYEELLSDMQSEARDANSERAKAGDETLEIVGWAARPRYVRAHHELFWAKELRFSDTPESILNYDVRLLGRRGVLSMNAVAGIDLLDEVEQGMQELLKAVSFQRGHRYEDFDPKIDKLAAYGIGGLIAGKLALKAGLFKGLIAAILGAKKLLIIAAVAIGAFLTKLFRRKKDEPSATAESS